MQQTTVKATPREAGGTRAVRRVRADGGIPGVVYGKDFGAPLPVLVDAKDLRAALTSHGGSAVLNLEIEGRGATAAIVQERQLDVVTKRLIHIDLHAIRLDEVVETHVRLVLAGTPPGVKEGGILDFVVREVTIESLPTDIPEQIEIDISGLNMFDTIHVRDIAAPAGVTIVENPDDIVVTILPPSKAEEEAPAVAEAPAEPELIGAKPAPEEAEETE
ncbi:MAG TPA: 50S ribosomal protein L25 [Candidatus Acidoferrales bacterium]|nr:50S ribosomal protein L25 [Candidatus Acidoferrales bacterium]